MAINRSAEAMTIFSVVQAGCFQYSHGSWFSLLGCAIPNQFGSLWVNLTHLYLWDIFAISTYLSVSLVFWWTGYYLSFAMLRDRIYTI
jgi:molybdopterin-containing oxidoreductase family membrane subunit